MANFAYQAPYQAQQPYPMAPYGYPMPGAVPPVPMQNPALQQPPQQPAQAQQAAPMMTPPTIHAEIIQAASMDEIERSNVAPGDSRMYMLKDESAIVIKTAYQNGFDLVIFDRRPPAPPAPQIDPRDYVTREELEARLAQLAAPAPAAPAARRTVKEDK